MHDGRGAELQALERALEFFGRAEEERPVDAVHQHVMRQHDFFLRAVVKGLLLDAHRLGHAAHEQQRREHHAHVDRHHQVDEHGERERHQQQQAIRARRAAQQAQTCGASAMFQAT